MSDITERLRDTNHSFTAANGRLEAADVIDAERALADDLYAVLADVTDEWDHTPEWFAKRSQALARYREKRGAGKS